MSMTALYVPITDDIYTRIKNSLLGLSEEEVTDVMADSDDEEESFFLDATFDMLHFIFTGVSGSEETDNILGEAIMGEINGNSDCEFEAVISNERLKEIVAEMKRFDMEKALESFTFEACKKAEVYPDVWDDAEGLDELKEDLRGDFKYMLEFYERLVNEEKSVAISIG